MEPNTGELITEYRKGEVGEWMLAEAKLAVSSGLELNPDLVDPDWYHIGNADFEDREALMLLVEAARHLCGVDRRGAIRRAERAIAKIRDRIR